MVYLEASWIKMLDKYIGNIDRFIVDIDKIVTYWLWLAWQVTIHHFGHPPVRLSNLCHSEPVSQELIIQESFYWLLFFMHVCIKWYVASGGFNTPKTFSHNWILALDWYLLTNTNKFFSLTFRAFAWKRTHAQCLLWYFWLDIDLYGCPTKVLLHQW